VKGVWVSLEQELHARSIVSFYGVELRSFSVHLGLIYVSSGFKNEVDGRVIPSKSCPGKSTPSSSVGHIDFSITRLLQFLLQIARHDLQNNPVKPRKQQVFNVIITGNSVLKYCKAARPSIPAKAMYQEAS